MSNLSRGLMIAAVLAFAGAIAQRPAHADTFGTRCDDTSQSCFAVRCDNNGNFCTRVSNFQYYDRTGLFAYRMHYVCDSDGDNCRWARFRIDTDED